MLKAWGRKLLWRHLTAKHSRPAVRWMNRFAFVGIFLGVFAWTSVLSIMDGLQQDRKDRVLKEKAHLLWEGPLRPLTVDLRENLEKPLGSELQSLRILVQSEGLLEKPLSDQRGRIVGSGVILQGVESFGSELWVGQELASVVKLFEGDLVRLRSVWKLDGIPLELPITQVFSSGVQEVDRLVVRMDRERLCQWLGIPSSVSRIELQLQDPFRVDVFREKLEASTGLTFKTWRQTEAALWYSLRLEKIVLSLVLSMTVLLGALAVHLALSVRIAEKTREIALLRGLGAPDSALMRLYLSEGLAIGVTAALSGLGVGYLFCHWIGKIYQFPDIYYLTQLPVRWSWPLNLGLTGIAILLATVASYWPAKRVSRVSILDGLRS